MVFESLRQVSISTEKQENQVCLCRGLNLLVPDLLVPASSGPKMALDGWGTGCDGRRVLKKT
jgi:hypothetical protein